MTSFTILTSILAFTAVQTNGFAPSKHSPLTTQLNAAERINQSIDLDSPKVATLDSLADGSKKVYCRCWQSGTFPLCDGAHVAHNKETGDNVGPLICSAAKPKEEAPAAEAPAAAVEVAAEATEDKASIFAKIKSMFKTKKEDDGLSFKEKLAKAGLSVLLSYGWVSNMSYSVTLSLAWYGFSKKTKLSPLAPGQWKPFLAVYAGFYVFNNIVRPIRFAASAVVSKYFDNAVAFIERKTKLSKKWSIFVMVFLANICGTFAAMGLGVKIASSAAGVPIFPAKV